jgi:ribosomal protein S12 methylthiotransferase accessory factor
MKTAPPSAARLELRDVPSSDCWDTIRRGSRLISPRVGLIRQVLEARHQAQDPAFFAAGVQAADVDRHASDVSALEAGGAGDDAATAMVAAICETAERYCSRIYDRDEMVLGPFRELAADAVEPDRLRLFSRQQVEHGGAAGLDYFDDSSIVRWVWGYSLTERRPRLVPASLVYLNYRAADGEARIGLNASTGLSAAATLEEAILGGLLEIVERDAVTVAWLHRRAGRRIEVDDDDLRQMLRARLHGDHPRVDVKVFDVTLDLAIPVVFLVMRRPAEFGPAVCVGSAARLAPRQAVRKCMREAGQSFPYLRYLLEKEKGWQPAPDLSNLVNFEHHVLHYLRRPDLVPQAFAFCDACEESVRLSELPDRSTGRVLGDLERCVECLGEAGYDVIAADLTTPDVREVGLRVVRVIIPGLVPLHGNHLRPYLGVRRLFDVPRRLGWDGRAASSPSGLNPFPHAFP